MPPVISAWERVMQLVGRDMWRCYLSEDHEEVVTARRDVVNDEDCLITARRIANEDGSTTTTFAVVPLRVVKALFPELT